MLGQRVITAIVLLAFLLPALFASGPWPFAGVTLILIAAAGWEWGRLNQMPQAGSYAMGLLLAAACLLAMMAGWVEYAPPGVWWAAAAVWIFGGAAALRGGPAAWPKLPSAARCLIGLLALWAAWLALSHARSTGLNFVLSIFCLVWVADIAAYFGGRALGRRKLAPTISRGKSWEGAWSGAAAVLLLGGVWAFVDHQNPGTSASLYTRLWQQLGAAGAVLSILLLSALSVVGDLFESLVKRAAGTKDSSKLLPGHGGVLDRVDALLPVFPVALALVSL